MTNRLLASIASGDQLNLQGELQKVAFLPQLHLDVEDGNFIPNITFGFKTIRAISSVWKGELDAHLFVTRPQDYIDDLVECGVNSISFQVEAAPYPLEVVRRIQKAGALAGVALNPGTPLDPTAYVFKEADYVLLMSSEPDGRGQVFLPHTFQRVARLRTMLQDHQELWVDGGIDEQLAVSLCRHGANVLVMGRAIFSLEDPRPMVKALTARINAL